MPKGDKLVQAVEAVHAAGLDETLWPYALSRVTALIGGVGTTFEAAEKSTMRLTDFWAHGIPPGSEIRYVENFISISPRIQLGFNERFDEIGYDYMLIDEAGIDRDAYYSDFLRPNGLRYFVSASLTRTAREYSCVAVHRSQRQGHVGARESDLMRHLLPHFRHAFDMNRRFREASRLSVGLGRALDWLADGVALMRADGKLLYANEALLSISCRNDGIRVSKDKRFEFASGEVGVRFGRKLSAACGLQRHETPASAPADLIVPRTAGNPPYVLSVRPLPREVNRIVVEHQVDAAVIVFVHDPLQRDISAAVLLREMFGLTEAEASLARAIQAGTPLAEYAGTNRLSLNTVYTHLRRLKEKTQTKRQAELIHKLNDLRLALRSE